MEFKDLLKLSSLTIPSAALHLGVSETSIYRYIRHGAPTMAHRALEFISGTHPDYYGLKFRREGIWCEHRLIATRKEITEIEWLMQREFIRGHAEGTRQK